MQPFKEDANVIIVSSDIPMITGRVIDDFIDRCADKDADLCYPIVAKTNQSMFRFQEDIRKA